MHCADEGCGHSSLVCGYEAYKTNGTLRNVVNLCRDLCRVSKHRSAFIAVFRSSVPSWSPRTSLHISNVMTGFVGMSVTEGDIRIAFLLIWFIWFINIILWNTMISTWHVVMSIISANNQRRDCDNGSVDQLHLRNVLGYCKS